jgi:hypothetical protein
MWIGVIIIAANLVFAVVLPAWHRSLMVKLHTSHLEIWQRMVQHNGIQRRLWNLTTFVPLWSWGSVVWFISRGYTVVDDTEFVKEASRFRFWLVLWLVEFAIKFSVGMVWIIFWGEWRKG